MFKIVVDKKSIMQPKNVVQVNHVCPMRKVKIILFRNFIRQCFIFIDVLQLAEALRVLRITSRKIRTVLWYWLYWSTNSMTNKVPLIARHQDEQFNAEHLLISQVVN
mgnify:CR=1 FL=1